MKEKGGDLEECNMTTAEAIAYLKRLGFSLAEISRQSNVSATSIGQWVAGARPVSEKAKADLKHTINNIIDEVNQIVIDD